MPHRVAPHILNLSAFFPLICLFELSVFIFLFINRNKEIIGLKLKIEDFLERINIKREDERLMSLKVDSCRDKLKKYNALTIVLDKLNKNLSVKETASVLIGESRSQVPIVLYSCIIYLFNRKNNSLSILASFSNPDTVIKSKKGDIFDQWLLRQNSPLLVEDSLSDFRFDFASICDLLTREIGSLISAPIRGQEGIIGILRLESPVKKAFDLEDLRILSTIADIGGTALENALYYAHAKELAIRDTLTGLYLHNYILERLEEEISNGKLAGETVSILILDIDYFKNYNDKYGHFYGDFVLKSLAGWLREFIKDNSCILGRLGGEEFLIIMPARDKKAAYVLAENLREVIQEKAITVRRKISNITISAGVASFPVDADIGKDLLETAHQAVYKSKHLGRNRVCLC